MSALQDAHPTRSPERAAAPVERPRAARGERLARAPRVLAVGFMFAYFGLGGLFVIGVILPLRLLFGPRGEPRDLVAQRLMQRALALYVRVGRAIDAFALEETRGAEWLRTPGALVVANHPTLLDVVMLIAQMPQADCVVKAEAWRNPFLRRIVRAAGYIPNNSAEELVELVSARLAAGRTVILFPEGSRSPEKGMRPFKRGAAHVLLASGAPAVPVVIRCEPPALKKGQPWYALPNARLRYSVTVDEPQRGWTEGLAGLPRSLAARRVNERMRDYFERRLGR